MFHLLDLRRRVIRSMDRGLADILSAYTKLPGTTKAKAGCFLICKLIVTNHSFSSFCLQLKQSLGGGEDPLTQQERLELANHPLRIQAPAKAFSQKKRSPKPPQAREAADRIARRILEANV